MNCLNFLHKLYMYVHCGSQRQSLCHSPFMVTRGRRVGVLPIFLFPCTREKNMKVVNTHLPLATGTTVLPSTASSEDAPDLLLTPIFFFTPQGLARGLVDALMALLTRECFGLP